MLAERLERLREVTVGCLEHPQSNLADFYREMGDIFGVSLQPHNRWSGFRVLRERWLAHIDTTLIRSILLIDEAQEMHASVLNELRILTSTRIDSRSILSVVLAGDRRLLDKLRREELLPLGSRIRTRLTLECATSEGLRSCVVHLIEAAGNAKLMARELIDIEADRRRLTDTVSMLHPRLLVLDPFGRLHRVDENAAADVAPLLAYLRELQRHFHTAVVLVHHARKSGHARAGQTLRGSFELHAWGDSNLYLLRERDQLWLSIEHRAALRVPALPAELHAEHDALALRIVEHQPPPDSAMSPPADRILDTLASASQPMTRRALRDACRMRAASVGDALAVLLDQGRIIADVGGFRIARDNH